MTQVLKCCSKQLIMPPQVIKAQTQDLELALPSKCPSAVPLEKPLTPSQLKQALKVNFQLGFLTSS